MLKFLRKKGIAKKILWFVAIIIIISFGFFGTAYLFSDSQTPQSAGKIFGKKISLQDFDRAFQNVRAQAIMQYGDNFQQISQFLNLDAETWDRLILLHEAKKQNIKVTDQEVIAAIESYPFFQRDGQFDTLLYNDILRYVFQMEPVNFEESVRETLKFKKMYDQQTNTAIVTDEEVLDAFMRDNEKIQISYALIKPDNFIDGLKSTEEELRQFYNDHKLEFIVPQSINADYILVSFNNTSASDNTIPENAQKSEAYEKAINIANQLTSNPDLKTVAANNGLTIQSTGYFSAQATNLPTQLPFLVLTEISKLSLGQVGGPFETPTGYVLVKVSDIKESYVPEYEEIKNKIQDAYLKEKASLIAKDKAASYAQEIKQYLSNHLGKDFAAAAKSLGLEIKQTPVFTRGTYLEGIGISADFQNTAFSLTKEIPVSDAISITNGYCILHLDDKFPANQDNFESEKETLREGLLAQKKNQFFTEYLSSLRLKANLIDNIPTIRGSQQ